MWSPGLMFSGLICCATCTRFRTGSVLGTSGARRGQGGPKIDPKIRGRRYRVLPNFRGLPLSSRPPGPFPWCLGRLLSPGPRPDRSHRYQILPRRLARRVWVEQHNQSWLLARRVCGNAAGTIRPTSLPGLAFKAWASGIRIHFDFGRFRGPIHGQSWARSRCERLRLNKRGKNERQRHWETDSEAISCAVSLGPPKTKSRNPAISPAEIDLQG